MLFWDERAGDVASQSRQTFGNPLEMGIEMQSVVDRIKTLDYYPYLWQQVYGNFEPTEDQVLECLQAFVGAMGSHDAIIDRSLEVAMDLFNVPTTVPFRKFLQPATDWTLSTKIKAWQN